MTFVIEPHITAVSETMELSLCDIATDPDALPDLLEVCGGQFRPVSVALVVS